MTSQKITYFQMIRDFKSKTVPRLLQENASSVPDINDSDAASDIFDNLLLASDAIEKNKQTILEKIEPIGKNITLAVALSSAFLPLCLKVLPKYLGLPLLMTLAIGVTPVALSLFSMSRFTTAKKAIEDGFWDIQSGISLTLETKILNNYDGAVASKELRKRLILIYTRAAERAKDNNRKAAENAASTHYTNTFEGLGRRRC